MSLRVNNNVAAVNAYRNLSVTDGQMAKSLEKLSSGFRINRAGDDAAGLVISETLRSQVGGLNQAVRNAQDGISVVQTAEGALSETTSMLQRMRDLTVQAGNGSNSADSIAAAQSEVDELAKSITDIANRTNFNGTDLLKTAGTITFQVGANQGETLDVATIDASAATLGVDALTIGGDRHRRRADRHRRGHQDRLERPRHARRQPEPARAHHQQPERHGGEPHRVGEPDPRHRHGEGDDELHPFADPHPGRHRDARAGQQRPAAGPAAPARLVPPLPSDPAAGPARAGRRRRYLPRSSACQASTGSARAWTRPRSSTS